MTDTAAGPLASDGDYSSSVRTKTLVVLGIAAILGGFAVASSITVQVLVAEDLLGSSRWAGIAPAFYTLGSAAAAFRLSSYMAQNGRRPGLRLGYLFGVVGAVIAFFGIQQRSMPMFLFGSMLFGCTQAANLSIRFAAADIATAQKRALYISLLVWVGAVGSTIGPLVAGWARDIALGRGWEELAGPYLVSAAAMFIAAALVEVALRPDPLEISGQLGDPSIKKAKPPIRDSLALIMSKRPTRIALATMMMSQAVMVSVMSMTPSHMKEHGHDLGLVGQVFSAHIAGMFLFAPLVGAFVDRKGRIPGVIVGAGTLMVATVLAALAAGRPALLFPALFLLGIGWNFGLIAGSTLLTETVDEKRRVGVQGSADALMSLCGGFGGLASGLVNDMAGYHILSNIGTVAAGMVLITVVMRRGMIQPSRPSLH